MEPSETKSPPVRAGTDGAGAFSNNNSVVVPPPPPFAAAVINPLEFTVR